MQQKREQGEETLADVDDQKKNLLEELRDLDKKVEAMTIDGRKPMSKSSQMSSFL